VGKKGKTMNGKLESLHEFWPEAEKLDPEGFARARRERAELEALRKDAERLDWMAVKVGEKSSVVLMPCGESLRFVQVRHFGDCENYPTVEGLRAAIDAAMAAAPAVG